MQLFCDLHIGKLVQEIQEDNKTEDFRCSEKSVGDLNQD